MGLYDDTRAQRGVKARIINLLTESKRNPNCSEKESFNTHPSSIQRRLVVIIRAASTVISFPPPVPLEINPSTLISVPPPLCTHTFNSSHRIKIPFPFSRAERTTNPFSNGVYIYIYVRISIEIGFRLLPGRHYLHSRNSSRPFFAQEPRRRNKFPRYLPLLLPPPQTEEKGGRLLSWHGFEEYRDIKLAET